MKIGYNDVPLGKRKMSFYPMSLYQIFTVYIYIYSRTSLIRTPTDGQNLFALSGVRIKLEDGGLLSSFSPISMNLSEVISIENPL